jgi:addiction module HigA family antidote
MQPKRRVPSHPGLILLQEFLSPLDVTQVDFAAHFGVPTQRVNEIVRGERGSGDALIVNRVPARAR